MRHELARQYLQRRVHPSRHHLWIAAYGQHRVCQRVVTASHLRCYRVANEYDVVSRVLRIFDFQHVGKIHLDTMGQRAAAAAFWPSAVGASCRHFMRCCGTTGVADHSMELYLDRLREAAPQRPEPTRGRGT